MRNKDAFSGYHPTINFLYFALVLLFSMCLMHPVYLAISLTTFTQEITTQIIIANKINPKIILYSSLARTISFTP